MEFDNIVFAPANVNFPTFKWMCKFGQLVGAEESLCAKTISFQNTKPKHDGPIHDVDHGFVCDGLGDCVPLCGVWEIWRFVRPGLLRKERKSSSGAVLAVSFLFLLGVSFGYYILSPMTIWFLSTYTISDVIVQ